MWGFLSYVLGLSHFQWYRRVRGGHWEYCWVEPCMGYMWMRVDHDKMAASALRTYGNVERLIKCEDWT
jgi:hypothetical protein